MAETSSDIEVLQARLAAAELDIQALQARLMAAGLDDSLPSKASAVTPVVTAASEPSKSTVTSDDFLDDEPRSEEELAKVKAAADAIDMEAITAIKTEGNEFFRNGDFKNACSTYLKAIRILETGSNIYTTYNLKRRTCVNIVLY